MNNYSETLVHNHKRTSDGRGRQSFWTQSFQCIPNVAPRKTLGSIKQHFSNKKHSSTIQLETSQKSVGKSKHVAKDAARGRRSEGKCAVPAAAAAVPRGMRRRVIYDPPAAPPPRTPLARTRQVALPQAAERERQRRLYGKYFEGWRCVMQACVRCARWTCSDGRSFWWQPLDGAELLCLWLTVLTPMKNVFKILGDQSARYLFNESVYDRVRFSNYLHTSDTLWRWKSLGLREDYSTGWRRWQGNGALTKRLDESF